MFSGYVFRFLKVSSTSYILDLTGFQTSCVKHNIMRAKNSRNTPDKAWGGDVNQIFFGTFGFLISDFLSFLAILMATRQRAMATRQRVKGLFCAESANLVLLDFWKVQKNIWFAVIYELLGNGQLCAVFLSQDFGRINLYEVFRFSKCYSFNL